jgi:hypothetical protein
VTASANPRVGLLVELGDGLAESVGSADIEAMENTLARALDDEFERLSLPATAAAEVRRYDGRRALQVSIGGRVLPYRPKLLVRAWMANTAHEHHAAPVEHELGSSFPDAWLPAALAALESSSRSTTIQRLAVTLAIAVVRQRPSCLFDGDVAAAYAARAAPKVADMPPATAARLPGILRHLLDLGVRLGGTDPVFDAISWGSKVGLPADELAEHVYADLRHRTVEVALHPDYLESLGLARIDESVSLSDNRLSDTWLEEAEVLDEALFQADGVLLPEVRLVPHSDVEPGMLEVCTLGIPGTRVPGLAPSELLVRSPTERLRQAGIDARPTIDVHNVAEASLVHVDDRIAAEAIGSVLDPVEFVLALVATEVWDARWRLVSVEDVDHYMTVLGYGFPAVVRASTATMPVAALVRTLRLLLQENLSIRNLHGILNRLLLYEHVGFEALPEEYADFVRRGFGDVLASLYAADGRVSAIRVDPSLEGRLAKGRVAASTLREYEEDRVRADVWSVYAKTETEPVLLTTSIARRPLRAILAPELPNLPVLAYEELPLDVEVATVGTITGDRAVGPRTEGS